jgi:citrate synthase
MLSQGKKIAGFGHRVYRTEDPRATHLRVLSEELGQAYRPHSALRGIAAVRADCQDGKEVNANVDFYLGVRLTTHLGNSTRPVHAGFRVSRSRMTPPHVLEQYHNNRLIRPRAEYKGNPDGMPRIR